MAEVTEIARSILGIYNEFLLYFCGVKETCYVSEFFNLLIFVLLVVLYSIFVWKFYKFISNKNPIGLNLNQYNRIEQGFFSRLMGSTLYLVEYIIILPFLIFFIYGIFTILLMILAQTDVTKDILTVSSIIIAAIRMTAYYKEKLSQEIAKIIPFTMLAFTALNVNLITNIHDSGFLDSIITRFSQIPSLWGEILFFLGFIIILEAILRLFDFLFSLFGLEEPDEEEEENEKEDKGK